MNRFFTVIARICRQANPLRMGLPQLWHDLITNPEDKMSAALLKNILEQSFPNATELEVKDDPKGYKIIVETAEFQGLSHLQQHRAVYAALTLPKHNITLTMVVCHPKINM